MGNFVTVPSLNEDGMTHIKCMLYLRYMLHTFQACTFSETDNSKVITCTLLSNE